jgi:hypothetical protein
MAKSLKTLLEPVPFVIYRQGTAPEPPPELAEGGAALWREIMADAPLPKAAQREVLRAACLARDEADRLRKAIEVAGDEVIGSAGTAKANPLLALEANARRQVVSFLAKLPGLASEDKRSPGRPPNMKPSA